MHRPDWYTRYLEEGIIIKIHTEQESREVLKILWFFNFAESVFFVPKWPSNYIAETYKNRKQIVCATESEVQTFFKHVPWTINACGFIGEEKKQEENQTIQQVMTVKIDYYQPPCPKCGELMKALFLQDYYCPRGCNC